jgi:hypothetical protein
MSTGAESTPSEFRQDRRTVSPLLVWVGTFAAGLFTTAVAVAGWVRLDFPTWPDKDPALGPPLAIVAVGAATAVAGACLITVLVQRRGPRRAFRLRRWAVAWATALAVSAVGLWGFAHFRDRANHARTTVDLVGTWHVLGPDETPWQEKTLNADGTYESTWLAGPAHERRTYRGTYRVSADGRHIVFRDRDSAAAELTNWEWNIEFADRDHFRVWSRVWHYTATDEYVRKE